VSRHDLVMLPQNTRHQVPGLSTELRSCSPILWTT